MVEKKVVKKIGTFVKELRKHRIRVAKIILFGSRTTSAAHEYSDIDVAVISPDFGKDRCKEGMRLFEIAYKVDPLIEPVPLSLRAYENDTWIPLVYEIRKNGIEIKTA